MSKNLTWSHLCECMVYTDPKHLLHTARAAEPQHIVAGDFTDPAKIGTFSASASWLEPGLHSPRQHERSGLSATEDLVSKLM